MLTYFSLLYTGFNGDTFFGGGLSGINTPLFSPLLHPLLSPPWVSVAISRGTNGVSNNRHRTWWLQGYHAHSQRTQGQRQCCYLTSPSSKRYKGRNGPHWNEEGAVWRSLSVLSPSQSPLPGWSEGSVQHSGSRAITGHAVPVSCIHWLLDWLIQSLFCTLSLLPLLFLLLNRGTC